MSMLSPPKNPYPPFIEKPGVLTVLAFNSNNISKIYNAKQLALLIVMKSGGLGKFAMWRSSGGILTIIYIYIYSKNARPPRFCVIG